MTKRIIKKTVSALVAMAAVALALIFINPIGTFSTEDGDEDNGIGAYAIVEVEDVQ